MKRYGKHTATTARTMYLRKNIARSRRRAKIVGFIYLLGIIALAAAACLPLMVHELAMVGIPDAWNVLKHLIVNLLGGTPLVVDKVLNCYTLDTYKGLAITINTMLYTLMLLVVVIKALKALGKLGWLFTSKGNREYGFNRNAYAMEDLGRLFSSSFAWILITYLLIGVVCGGFVSLVNTVMLIVIAAGVVIHLICGFFGAKVRYYDLENGQIVEQKRLVGRFACIVRNVFQIAAVAGILYFLNFEGLAHEIGVFLGSGEAAAMNIVVFAMQMFVVLCLFVLIKHATGLTEYSMEGIYGSGMKNFRIFTFLAFLAAAAGAVICLMNSQEYIKLVIVAGIAFVSFVIECIMRKYPRLPETVQEGKLEAHDGEFSFEMFTRMQQGQGQNNANPYNAINIF